MQRKEIENIIIAILADYFEIQGINEKVTPETKLFGRDSSLDSMGLVNIVVDIESKFAEEGIEISLMSENAMSRSKSPFISINTLAEFVEEQIISE